MDATPQINQQRDGSKTPRGSRWQKLAQAFKTAVIELEIDRELDKRAAAQQRQARLFDKTFIEDKEFPDLFDRKISAIAYIKGLVCPDNVLLAHRLCKRLQNQRTSVLVCGEYLDEIVAKERSESQEANIVGRYDKAQRLEAAKRAGKRAQIRILLKKRLVELEKQLESTTAEVHQFRTDFLAKLHGYRVASTEKLLKESSTSPAMGVVDRMEQKILDREKMADAEALLPAQTFSVNSELFLGLEKRAHESERNAEASLEEISKFAPVEIETLSAQEIKDALKKFNSAEVCVQEGYKELEAVESELQNLKFQIKTRRSDWLSEEGIKNELKGIIVDKAPELERTPFDDSVKEVEALLAEHEAKIVAINELRNRLKTVSKKMAERLAAIDQETRTDTAR